MDSQYLQELMSSARRASRGLLAIALFSCGSDDEAGPSGEADLLKRYVAAVEADPDNPVSQYNLAVALARTDRVDEAAAGYFKAMQLDSTYAMPYQGLGQLAARKGDRDGARRFFQPALRLDWTLAESYNNLGHIARHEGDLTTALSFFEAAVRQAPDTAVFEYNRGQVLLQMDRLKDGKEAMERCVQLDGSFAPGHRALGDMYASRQRFDEAIQSYRRALRLDPQPSTHVGLGDVYAAAVRLDDAV